MAVGARGAQDPDAPPLLEAEATPACVALVDACGGPDWLEAVRSALLASLEALPPTALFGLATFSDQARRCSACCCCCCTCV